MKEPSFETREERLNAKPLDWNSRSASPRRAPFLQPRKKRCEKPSPNRHREARRIQTPRKKPASSIRMSGNDAI
jgi:hypothetical protein